MRKHDHFMQPGNALLNFRPFIQEIRQCEAMDSPVKLARQM